MRDYTEKMRRLAPPSAPLLDALRMWQEAPDHDADKRHFALCSYVSKKAHPHRYVHELWDYLRSTTGRALSPFNDTVTECLEEADRGESHLNKARVAWVQQFLDTFDE